MSSIRPDAPILPIPEASIPVATSQGVAPAAAIAAISTPPGSGIAIEGAEALSIATISHFESLLAESERDLRPAYETLPESLRHKIEELVYWNEVEKRGKESITDPQYGERAVESDIRVLFDIELKGLDQIPELLSLSELLQAPDKNIPAIQTAWNLLSPDIKNKIYDSIYNAHVIRNGKALCPDQNGEPFGCHYTREHLRNLLTMQVPKFGTTLWKEAIISTVISTAGKANALQYRIPGKGLIAPEALQQHYNEADDSKFLDTICFLLSNGWSVGPEYRPETKTLSQDSFNKAVGYAVSNRHLEAIQFLFSQGRSIPQEYLEWILQVPAQNGHLEVIQFLLSQGRSIRQKYLEWILQFPAEKGHLEVIRFFLSQGRSISEESLVETVKCAAENGHLEVIQFLLSEGRSLSQQYLGWMSQYPARNGHLEVVQFFLSQGRSISEESLGETVKCAAENGHLGVVQFLLSEGRSLSQQYLGWISQYPAQNGHLEVIQFLLPEVRSIFQAHLAAAVRAAAQNGHLEVIRFLLSEGNILHLEQREHLIIDSAFRGHTSILEFFLQQGPIHEQVRDSAITQAGRSLHDPSLQLIGTIQDILRMAPVIPAQPGALVAIPIGSFVTTLDSVNSDPKAHLKTICEDGFPRRVVLSDNPSAIDLGGVTKQFISTLMKALRPKILLTEAGLPQNERADDSHSNYKLLYTQLGRFYALMDARNEDRTDKFVTGPLFHPRFFTIVKTIATESSLENRRREVAKQVLEVDSRNLSAQLVLGLSLRSNALASYRIAMDCKEGKELETAQAEVDSFIEAAQNFYDGATGAFQTKIRDSDPTLLARILQGAPASQEALLAAIEKDARLPEERFRWIQEKIRSSDEPWRIRFVKAITGNEVLSPGIRILIGASWRGPGVFELHTCFNSLDVPRGAVPENLKRSIAEEVLAAEPENIGALLVLGREVTPEALQRYRTEKGCPKGQELKSAKKEIDRRQFLAALDAILAGEGYNIA